MKRKLFLLLCAVLTMFSAKAQSFGDDYTSYITNASITSNMDGWTPSNATYVKYYGTTGFDGTNSFIEMTNWNSSWELSVSQTVSNLPNGYYLLKAAGQLSSATDITMKLVGNDKENYFHRNGANNGNILADGTETTDGSGVAGWHYCSVITQVTDGTLDISVVGKSTAAERWANVDAFTLTYLGSEWEDDTDVTGLIQNNDFNAGSNGSFTDWTISAPNGGNTWINGTSYVEYWIATLANGSFDYYQTVTDLPSGLYSLSASMWNGQGNGANGSCGVYGTSSNGTAFAGVTTTSENDALATYSTGSVLVTDGTLRVGVKNNSTMAGNWFGVDWIKLNFVGRCIAGEAVALPDGGAMEADTWYYFTPDAGNYNLTATTLGNIVYTTDGTILLSNESSVTDEFSSSNPVTLSATTYYIKSTSANSFAYEVDSYDLTEQIAAYTAAVTAANTAKTNADAADKVNAEEYTALTTAISTYGSVDYSGTQNLALKTALETATTALTSAATAINTSITAYANAKTYFDAIEPLLETTNFYTSSAYSTNYPKAAYEAGTLSDEDAAALSYGSRTTGNMPALLLSPWTATGTALYINTWSDEAEGSGDAADFDVPFYEYWVTDANNLGANTFTATIDGLTANATYAVTMNVRVKQRNGYAKVANSITLQVGSGDAIDLTQGNNIAMTRRFIDEYTAYGSTDEEGNLTITITVAANSNISWLSFRDVKYTTGSDALTKAIAEVTALNGNVPTNVYSTAYAQVTAYSGDNYPSTTAGFTTAINAIHSAATTAATYVDAYAAYAELKDYADALVAVANDNDEANSTLTTAISTAATTVASVASVSDLETATSTLKTAMTTYAAAANPVGDGNKFNLTFMLGVTNFDDYVAWEDLTVNGISGWATEQSGGNFQIMKNDAVTNGDYHSFIEYWSETPMANGNFNLYTTVEDLPVGTYTMSCYAFAGPNGYASAAASSVVYFYANDTQGGLVSDETLTQKEISFVNTSKQDVNIGLKPLSGNTWRWMGIGYVELYKVPAQTYTLSENEAWDYTQSGAGDVTVTRTIKEGINTVVFPFSMTQVEVESFFGTDSKVYEVSSYDSDTDNISFTSKSTGISANTPCLVKATSTTNSGQEYVLADRTIVAAASNAPTIAGTGVSMVGSYAASITVPEDNYIINGGYIYLVDSDVTMKNTRAYFTISSGGSARLTMTLDGEETAISTLDAAEADSAEAIQDGKYLENGRIVIVKNGVKYNVNGQRK